MKKTSLLIYISYTLRNFTRQIKISLQFHPRMVHGTPRPQLIFFFSFGRAGRK